MGYPPDTETPGYKAENATKPQLCKDVNATLGSALFPADQVPAGGGGCARGHGKGCTGHGSWPCSEAAAARPPAGGLGERATPGGAEGGAAAASRALHRPLLRPRQPPPLPSPPARQVASTLLRGIECGAYHLPSPDLGQNLLVASMASLTPRPLPLAAMVLLGPLLPPVMSALTWLADRAARRANARAAAAGSDADQQ